MSAPEQASSPQLTDKASDLAFLDNIDELNEQWPDYQARGLQAPPCAPASASSCVGRLAAPLSPPHAACCLQDFQSATEDVFGGQLLAGRVGSEPGDTPSGVPSAGAPPAPWQ